MDLWEFTANAFNVVDGVNPHQVLVVRVKVRPVMGRARLRKHPDNDPIEPSNFRHRLSPDSHVAPSRLLPQTTPKEYALIGQGPRSCASRAHEQTRLGGLNGTAD